MWMNPENLNATQRTTLSWVAQINEPLYRAYVLKDGLRTVCHQGSFRQAKERLDDWLKGSWRCRIDPLVKRSETVPRRRDHIEAAWRRRLSNAIVERKNTKLRLLHRTAHGFHDVQAFISLAMLTLGGLCPPLPGRT